MARPDRRAPSAFTSSVPLVVGSDNHRASPPGWVGIIELCGRGFETDLGKVAPDLVARARAKVAAHIAATEGTTRADR
jgi:hypothetical protein